MTAISMTAIWAPFRIREQLIKIKANPQKVSLGYALGLFLGTTPLFYGLAFFVGRWVLGADVVFVFPDTLSFSAFWEAFAGNRMIFYSLLIGELVLGVPMAVGAYYLSMFILTGSRVEIKGTKAQRHRGTEAQGRCTEAQERKIECSTFKVQRSRYRAQSTGHRVLDPGVRHPASSIRHSRSRISNRTSRIPIPSPPVYTLITGASSGLGKEMAIECAAQGRNLILVALPGRNMDVLCSTLEMEHGIRAVYYEKDLTNREEIHDLVDDILNRYRVNFLINNAGIGGTSPFGESSPDFLEKLILLNITAVSLLTRLLLPELKRHPEAHIINVSSMAAFSPFPYKTIYPASKAFVSSFSRSLGEELKETSVKVCVLHPGPILTNPDVIIRIIRQGNNGKRGLLPARILARAAINGVVKGKRVVVPGISNKLNRLLMTTLPEGIIVPFLSRVMIREITAGKKMAA